MSKTSATQRCRKQAADKNAIRPFHVNFPQAELTELRRRIEATRWPERETIADASQGVQLATIQELARYWATGVNIPVAVSVFPDELYPVPRSWAEQAFPKLIHVNKVPEGGHFAAWGQPKLFSEEIRAGFRSLR